jgi:hypothetical protein
LFLGIGLWLIRLEPVTDNQLSGEVSTQWVRTSDGWQRSDALVAKSSGWTPRLHPLVVAAGQALFAIFALVAAPSSKSAFSCTDSLRLPH